MAKCDEGYLCEVCGEEVEQITESDLYLRFVIGMLDPELLHTMSERHIRCNAVMAQFIVDDDFEAVIVEGDFDKRSLDPTHVAQRELLLTRGWRRLAEVAQADVPITEYPLVEVRSKYEQPQSDTPQWPPQDGSY